MKLLSFLFVLLELNPAFCQSNGKNQIDSLRILNTADSVISFGYNSAQIISSTPIKQLRSDDFNRGNISDPLQLIQGKFSGLLIAKPGNNPNEGFTSRLRGVNSLFMSASPLILVDGVPSASLLNVDPMDVEKITVIKDGASASQYGARSSSGAILIDTYKGDGAGLIIKNYIAVEMPDDQPGQPLSAKEYTNLGGSNLGYETNWYNQITRTAISKVTHIAYGIRKGNTELYSSYNYRDNEGILKNSGFKSNNFRFKVNQILLENRLNVGANFSATSRNSNFSFNEAFKYAKIFNPTAPVFNSSGDYYQTIIYDYFNPVGMIQQNINDGKLNVINVGLHADWKISQHWHLNGAWSREMQHNDLRKYWSKNSIWEGFSRNGLRDQESQDITTDFTFLSAGYNKKIREMEVNGFINYSVQDFKVASNFIETANFLTDDLGIQSVYNSLNWSGSKGTSYQGSQYFKSIRGQLTVNTRNIFFLTGNLNFERTRWLDATTWGISTGVNLINKKYRGLTQLKPRVGIGQTAGAMSFIQNYNPSNILQAWSISDKMEKPEKKSEVDFGIDWAVGSRVNGTLDFFSAKARDVITYKYINQPGTVFTILDNVATIENSGWEMNANWKIFSRTNFSTSTSLNFSTIKNTYKSGQDHYVSIPEIIPGGLGFESPVSLASGKSIGQINGYIYEGIKNGKWVFKDSNHDGFIDLYDQESFGRPFPSSFLGWSSFFRIKKLSVNMVFRGAFGHTLFNAYRLGYENPFIAQTYNAPRTISNSDILSLITSNTYSNFYLEKASYLKLDNLSLNYDFSLVRSHAKILSFFITAQNLFTATSLKNNDPEVRLNYQTSQIIMGYNSLSTYGSSKTFLIGVELKMK